MLASVTAAAAAVAAIAFVAVRPAPGVSAPELTEEHIMTMAMSGTTSDQADSVDVSIFLCKRVDPFPECEEGEATEERKAEIRRTLDALPEVKYVHFEDQRVAYESFKAEYRENTVLMGAIQVEDMPESFRVRVVDSADRQMIGTVEEAVQGLPGISNIVNRFCLLHKEEC
ncbi:hypothetical protein Pve01_38200 [Planomonospora venezuelensis]|nr:hypothetical protein Pve01_38200 [Planomonospora venezuelensis]